MEQVIKQEISRSIPKAFSSWDNYIIYFFMAVSTLLVGADIWAVSLMGVSLRIDQIFLVITAILMFIKGKFHFRTNVFLFLFIFGAFFSTIFSYNIVRSSLFLVSIIYNAVFLFYLYANLIIYFGKDSFIKMFRQMNYILFILLIVQYLCFYLLHFEIPFLPTYGSYFGIQRFCLFFYEPSYFATYLIIWYTLSWYSLLVGKDKSYIKDVIFCSLMLVASTSTTGIVGLFLTIIFVYITYLKKGITIKKLIFPIIIIVLALAVFIFLDDLYYVFVGRMFNSSLDDASGGRLSGISATFEVWKHTNLLLGTGPGCYGLFVDGLTTTVPTNLTMDLLSTLGIFGVIFFYGLSLSISVHAIKEYKQSKDISLPALVMALWIFTILLQMNQSYLRLYHWMLLGIIEGLTIHTKQERIKQIENK